MTRDYFHSRLDVLGVRKRQLDAPVDIQYTRGQTTVVIVEVSIGKTAIEELYPGIDILVKEIRDYIFDFGLFPSSFGLPKPGDRIKEVQSGLECDVVAVNEDHCFRWTTATRKRIRVHTQIVSQVNQA